MKKKIFRDIPEKTNIYRQTIQLIGFLKIIDVKLTYFFISVFLSVLSAIFGVLSIRLLIPLLAGMMKQDFNFVGGMPILKWIVSLFSRFFTDSRSMFFLLVSVIFIIALLKCIFHYAASISIARQVRQATSSLRKLIFNRYLTFGKLYYDRHNIGGLSTALIRLTQIVTGQLTSLQRMLSQVFTLFAYFVIMFLISWKLTLLTLLIFFVFFYINQRMIKGVRSISQHHAASEDRLDEKVFNVLSSIPLVKSQAMEEKEKELFDTINDEEAELAFQYDMKEKLISPIQEFGELVAFLLLGYLVTAFFSPGRGEVLSSYLVFFLLVRLSMPGFGIINQYLISLSKTGVRIARILDILDDRMKFIIKEGDKTFGGLKRDIEFRNLTFSYRGKKPVLDTLSFVIDKGKTTAIVGPTGTGKTTVINLILRFYDCPPGTIFIDGADIRDFTLKSLSNHFAYVSQDALLFNDTLRANMAYGLDGKVNDEMILTAAKKTRLYDFIIGLPEGLDTMIGDKGVQLSGGEKQRVSITRALLKNSEILILDEATSSLDSVTERLIRDAIDEALNNKTAIVIAHRLSTIRRADKVLVINNGKMAEEGTFDELLQKKERFYELWNGQKFF